MIKLRAAVVLPCLLFLLGLSCGAPPAEPSAGQAEGETPVETLKVGDEAPDFELVDQNRETVKLSSFRGEKNVVVAFYVLAFTGGWRRELTSYQDDIDFFNEHDTEILAISIDAQPSQRKFAEEIGAQYRFLADWPNRDVSRLYGVLSDNGYAERTTFVIDKEGVIRRIDRGREAMDIAGVKSTCREMSSG